MTNKAVRSRGSAAGGGDGQTTPSDHMLRARCSLSFANLSAGMLQVGARIGHALVGARSERLVRIRGCYVRGRLRAGYASSCGGRNEREACLSYSIRAASSGVGGGDTKHASASFPAASPAAHASSRSEGETEPAPMETGLYLTRHVASTCGRP